MKYNYALKKIGTFLLDLLYPRRCPWCDAVLGFSTACNCSELVRAAARFHSPQILTQNLMAGGLRAAYAPLRYVSPVREAIHRMKQRKDALAVEHYAQQMVLALPKVGACPPFDAIVPIPGTKREFRGRENLPSMLAKALSAHLNVPVRTDLIIKIRETKRQSTLSGKERRANLEEAYALQVGKEKGLQGYCVLLVDDVFTTGTTMHQCAKPLHQKGALCYGLCIAVAGE